MIYCDNSSAITLSKNYVFHKRTKHIDAKFHYIREIVNNGEIILKHCRNQEQFANILTKPLGQKSFEYLRKCMGMTDNSAVELKGECWNVNFNCMNVHLQRRLCRSTSQLCNSHFPILFSQIQEQFISIFMNSAFRPSSPYSFLKIWENTLVW